MSTSARISAETLRSLQFCLTASALARTNLGSSITNPSREDRIEKIKLLEKQDLHFANSSIKWALALIPL